MARLSIRRLPAPRTGERCPPPAERRAAALGRRRPGDGRAVPATHELPARARRRGRAGAVAGAGFALTLAVAACGSAPSASGPTGNASQGTTTPSSTTTASSTTTGTGDPPDNNRACTAEDLRFRFDRTTGTAGTELLLFSVRDTTGRCELAGYFGISLYSSSGRLLAGAGRGIAMSRDGTPVRPETITLEPGAEATTGTAFPDNAPTGSGVACTKVAAAQLIPPEQTSGDTVPIPRASRPMFCSRTPAIVDAFATQPGPPPADYR